MEGEGGRNILMRVLERFEKTLGDGGRLVETEVVEEVLQNGFVDDELGDVVVLRVGWVKWNG
jgi:hypothetical protein